jgi:hypothetical protein
MWVMPSRWAGIRGALFLHTIPLGGKKMGKGEEEIGAVVNFLCVSRVMKSRDYGEIIPGFNRRGFLLEFFGGRSCTAWESSRGESLEC